LGKISGSEQFDGIRKNNRGRKSTKNYFMLGPNPKNFRMICILGMPMHGNGDRKKFRRPKIPFWAPLHRKCEYCNWKSQFLKKYSSKSYTPFLVVKIFYIQCLARLRYNFWKMSIKNTIKLWKLTTRYYSHFRKKYA